MARRRPSSRRAGSPAERVLAAPDTTLVDLLDRLLDTGVMLTGDVTIGVAGVDLIYLRLSALLCAADRVLPSLPAPRVPRPRPALPRRSRR